MVRFTFEKTKCPLSTLWSILEDYSGGAETSASDRMVIDIKNVSLRKMSMEEIFAAMVDAAKKKSRE